MPLGLQFSNVMVIRSRAAHRPKQLALSQEVPPPPCHEHKSPSPRRAAHSWSTWGPLTLPAALRNGSAGAALLRCRSAAAPALRAPAPFGATPDLVSAPDAAALADCSVKLRRFALTLSQCHMLQEGLAALLLCWLGGWSWW